LIALGCANACETTLASQPVDIIFDRTYVHGTTNLDVRRCFGFNGARLAVIESYVSECHSGFDAQAVAGWNGPGPFQITNNYLEGAAEYIAFGGADPVVYGVNLIPSDIEIRGNYIAKPMTWKGSPWLVKNLIEFKSGGRVLIDGNVLENSIQDAQAGYAFALWSVNQPGSNCSWCATFDVTIQNNLIRNVAAGFNLAGKDYRTESPLLRRVTVRNNVIFGMANPQIGGIGRMFQVADGVVSDLTVEHNTFFTPNGSTFVFGDVGYPNLVKRNNLMGGGQLQLFSAAGVGSAVWNAAAGPGSAFLGNVVALAPAGSYPAGNGYPGSYDAVGLAGGGTAALSVSASLNDIGLSSNSPYKGQATDGKDPGADVTAIASATANVKQQ